MFIDFREGKGEKHRLENNMNPLPPVYAPTRDRTGNLGTCPDGGSNPQPLVYGDNAPTTGKGQVCWMKAHW